MYVQSLSLAQAYICSSNLMVQSEKGVDEESTKKSTGKLYENCSKKSKNDTDSGTSRGAVFLPCRLTNHFVTMPPEISIVPGHDPPEAEMTTFPARIWSAERSRRNRSSAR
ncbi:hypothetical protein PUN28_011837 [Cardiocondyla obscurior]|uniref:Uncharacterized protein n=1 Tax=Cardiocondyla obscurior TaxID=286306 RepID=A0AAW2FJ62_9HYME